MRTVSEQIYPGQGKRGKVQVVPLTSVPGDAIADTFRSMFSGSLSRFGSRHEFQDFIPDLSHSSHYCNSLLIGLPKTRLAPLQTVLNAASRIMARLPPYSHTSDYMIKELHWLPILARVGYKVLILVAMSKQVLAPRYLCELMSKPLSPPSSSPLRSAERCDRLVPWSRTSLFQNRAFAVVCPALWNDIPPALRSVMLQGISSASLRSLKTFLFTSLSR